jgi:hypothetical protein
MPGKRQETQSGVSLNGASLGKTPIGSLDVIMFHNLRVDVLVTKSQRATQGARWKSKFTGFIKSGFYTAAGVVCKILMIKSYPAPNYEFSR